MATKKKQMCSSGNESSGAIYGLGFIGAAIYYISMATGLPRCTTRSVICLFCQMVLNCASSMTLFLISQKTESRINHMS